MKTTLRHCAAAVGAAAVLAFTSCVYDPYYSPYGDSYQGSYGYGYGYGGSHFSTSFFVSTGDVRWGYDPYCHSYYDYHRRAYYDPYLYGYYPVGYRPQVVIGVPHPYGWRQGQGYCPPPRRVNQVTVTNYQNRASAYRNSNYEWAKQVRQQPISHNRVQGQPSSSNPYNRSRNDYRPSGASDGRQSQGWNPFSPSSQTGSRQSHDRQYQSSYNRHVTASSAPPSYNRHATDSAAPPSFNRQRNPHTQDSSSPSPQGSAAPFRHSRPAPPAQLPQPQAPAGRPAASEAPPQAPANTTPGGQNDFRKRHKEADPSTDQSGSPRKPFGR